MPLSRAKGYLIGAVLAGFVFGALMLVRLQGDPGGVGAKSGERPALAGALLEDTWMNVFQNGRKIGYVQRTFFPTDTGYAFDETVAMRVNVLGVVQGMTIVTGGALNRDMTLASFSLELKSNLFRYVVRGVSRGAAVTVFAGLPGEEKRYDLTLPVPPMISQGVLPMLLREPLGEGESRTLKVFDPSTLAMRPVTVRASGEETRLIGGRLLKLRKLVVTFMGARQTAFVDAQGQVVREEGALGLALERTTKADALRGLGAADPETVDLAELASIRSDRILDHPSALKRLRVRLDGVDLSRYALDGGRQRYRDGVLDVAREDASATAAGAVAEASRKPTPFIQSDAPEIRDAVERIVRPEDDELTKARKITAFVWRHLTKRPVPSLANAVETLRNRMGDCTEHAVLVAALGRAAGLPTVVETGLMYQNGRFYYHAWNAFYIRTSRQWVSADAVFHQIPADVTHLRFVSGDTGSQLDLVGLLGRLTLNILEAS